jgi:twitching motility protein PilT
VTTLYASEAFLHQILGKAVSAGASDVHLKVGQPPGARVRGDLAFFRGDRMQPEDTEAALRILLGSGAEADLARSLERVFAYEAPGLGRFRVSAYRQRGSFALVMRSIPLEVPKLAALGLPAAAAALVEAPQGLVVLAGGSGEGKSTTAAALVGHLAEASPRHVITLEAPIEHIHPDRRGSVSQRAVGVDTGSFAEGLRAALKQDADVLYAAHLDSPAALEAALDAAELGHRVLVSVAAPDVAGALGRLFTLGQAVPSFAARFAEALQGALGQRLLRKRDGSGLVPACEALVATAAVREVLRGPMAETGADLAAALRGPMAEAGSPHGMQTFEMHVEQLGAQGVIARSARAP